MMGGGNSSSGGMGMMSGNGNMPGMPMSNMTSSSLDIGMGGRGSGAGGGGGGYATSSSAYSTSITQQQQQHQQQPRSSQPGNMMMSSQPGPSSDTVLVRNLPLDFNWQNLREGFSHCGEIKYAEIKERGMGLVRFAMERDAERAVCKEEKKSSEFKMYFLKKTLLLFQLSWTNKMSTVAPLTLGSTRKSQEHWIGTIVGIMYEIKTSPVANLNFHDHGSAR